MSLHGTVQINGRLIATWSAQRITNTDDAVLSDDTVSTYRCSVVPRPPRDVDGFSLERIFDVDHRYGDRAAGLAALVLETYNREY
jgi:hypothetical protein